LCKGCEEIVSGDASRPPEPDRELTREDAAHQPWLMLLVIQERGTDVLKPFTVCQPDKADVDETSMRLIAIERRMHAFEEKVDAIHNVETRAARLETSLIEIKGLLMGLIPDKDHTY